MEARKFNRLLKTIKTNEKSFNELYMYYGKRIVFHLCGTYGRTLAEDVSQEFFMKLMSDKIDFGYIDMPTIWVYTCCENAAKTKLRTEAKYRQLYDDMEYSERSFEQFETRLYLDKLDETARRIISLYYWYGYNLKEIAEMLKMNYATVRKIHSRTIEKLNKLLE